MNVLLDNMFVGYEYGSEHQSIVMINKSRIETIKVENVMTEDAIDPMHDLCSPIPPKTQTRLAVKTRLMTWLIEIPETAEERFAQADTLIEIYTSNIKKQHFTIDLDEGMLIPPEQREKEETTTTITIHIREDNGDLPQKPKVAFRVEDVHSMYLTIENSDNIERVRAAVNIKILFDNGMLPITPHFVVPIEETKQPQLLLHKLLTETIGESEWEHTITCDQILELKLKPIEWGK